MNITNSLVKGKVPFNAKLISGIVSDELGPLASVNISIKGTDSYLFRFWGYFQMKLAKR
jgi:hypothetical protein